jgi:hypothetical protein
MLEAQQIRQTDIPIVEGIDFPFIISHFPFSISETAGARETADKNGRT